MRRGVAVAAAAMIASACAPPDEPANVPIEHAEGLVTAVVDSVFDAGRGAAVVLDANGNPAISYLLLAPVLMAGELPPAPQPGAPQPPAVMIATNQGPVWTRTSVTPQKTSPAEGDAPEIANDEKQAKPGVETDLAVASDGTFHVVWSSPNGLFHSSGGPDGFSERVKVAPVALGASIAVDGATPWISYYYGGRVRVATPEGDGWALEDVAEVERCSDCPPVRTAMDVADGGPVVAFTDPTEDTPMLAGRESFGWAAEDIEDGGGGYGMSLDVDADGNPHVAYYTRTGEVHHAHSVSGGPWEVVSVGGGGAPEGATPEQTAGWSAGIAVDDQNVPHVTFLDPSTSRVMLADDAQGGFDPQPVPGGGRGSNPAIAVTADGRAAVTWFDSANRNLDVSRASTGEVPVAFSPRPPTMPTGPSPPPTEAPCQPEGTELTISALNTAFDKDCLAAPAGEPFTIEFNNQEAVPHNVSVYTDSTAAERLGGAADPGDIVTGPTTVTYEVEPLEEGIYYFRCDVHPTMQGTFVSAEMEGG